MAKESIRVELDQRDIKLLVSEKYNLDVNSASISVSHFKGDQREGEHTSIIVTGQKNK